MPSPTSHPADAQDRTRWIQDLRRMAPGKNALDPWVPYAFLEEVERAASGEDIPTATLFLTNRECPYRCLMCDLWQNTLDDRVPNGAIAVQIRYALARLPSFARADPML